MATVTSIDSSVYYKEQYWDSFPQAKVYIQTQVSDNPKKDSLHDFKERYCKKPFRHGLFLNCGNGWLERWFIRQGLVQSATAFDCSETLINEAKRKGENLPITYFVADANKIDLPPKNYDLVVNSAALHHVQFINRFCDQIWQSMTSKGIFFHYDYIGPHRNQYSDAHWKLIHAVNNSLPKTIRKKLEYPHLPTMMISDPSEAIHSELIIETLQRFFEVKEQHNISGMIAYNILSLNPKLHKGQRSGAIQKVLDKDKEAFLAGKTPPMFTYMITKPKKVISKNRRLFWQLSEDLRERDAKIIEWTYSTSEYLKLINHSKWRTRVPRLLLFYLARVTSFVTLLFAGWWYDR
ncbi:MAG TPA: class I SAM-dependent methyltransferase [Patescibacteria group bacterium]|nr:class I SAM-dependent methyltransferase [Patescibacteria group bacterium]